MARYPTKRAVSAGGVVVDHGPTGRRVVLIARRAATGALQWTLPKGRLEAAESLTEAALREVLEETGLQCRIVSELGVVDYWFVWHPDGVRYHKFVHYYLMAHDGEPARPRDDEAEDVQWVPFDEALARLTHANERRLVEQAFTVGGGR